MRRHPFAIILVTILLFLPSCNYIRQHIPFGKYSLKKAIEWAKADSTRVADSLNRTLPDKEVFDRMPTDSMEKVMSQKKVFEKALTDSLISIEDESLPEGDTSPLFFIITGSYLNHENAVQAAGQYSRQGYNTTILSTTTRNGDKSELVSVKAFKDRSEADIFIREFKAKIKPDAWIYSRK